MGGGCRHSAEKLPSVSLCERSHLRLAKMEMTVTKPLGSPFALCRERRRKPSPGWETKSPLLADPGFCSNPQGPRGDQRMRFIGQAGAALQGLSPQGLALFPAPSLAGGSGEGLTPGLAA